ncbi:MAG: hypothetical protein R3A13_04795 [Bdellovibrionota bacterium]
MILPILSELQLSSWERKLIGSALIAGIPLTELAVCEQLKTKLERISEITYEIPDSLESRIWQANQRIQ